MAINDASTVQLSLGCIPLAKGYLCKYLNAIQLQWQRQHCNTNREINMFAKKVINLLKSYTLDVWDQRNTIIHGKNNKETKNDTKKEY